MSRYAASAGCHRSERKSGARGVGSHNGCVVIQPSSWPDWRSTDAVCSSSVTRLGDEASKEASGKRARPLGESGASAGQSSSRREKIVCSSVFQAS